MAMGPEERVKHDVKKLLKERGVWFYMPVQNGMGVVGIPDFVCCYKGMFLVIETKRPNKTPTTLQQRIKKLSPNQLNRLREIQSACGVALVVDDARQVDEVLETVDMWLRLQNLDTFTPKLDYLEIDDDCQAST